MIKHISLVMMVGLILLFDLGQKSSPNLPRSGGGFDHDSRTEM
jgi:hypothetical protein